MRSDYSARNWKLRPDNQSAIVLVMNEEDVEERLEELQEQVDAYRKRIETLEEELKIVVRFGNFVTHVLSTRLERVLTQLGPNLRLQRMKRSSANGAVSSQKNTLSLKSQVDKIRSSGSFDRLQNQLKVCHAGGTPDS